MDLCAFAVAEGGLEREGIALNAGSCQRSWDFTGAGSAGSAWPHLMISYGHTCESAGSRNKKAKPAPVRSQAGTLYWSGRGKSVLPTPIGGNMDNTTLLIVLIVVLIVLGGGWYGRGRWY